MFNTLVAMKRPNFQRSHWVIAILFLVALSSIAPLYFFLDTWPPKVIASVGITVAFYVTATWTAARLERK